MNNGAVKDAEASARRTQHKRLIEVAARASRDADQEAEVRRDTLYVLLDAAHGRREDGRLTYDEIAEATGWSRSWIRIAIGNYRRAKAAVDG